MRLTCPNCEAQYEVPDSVIPAAGRDVQCSSCGNTWFQPHPDHEPDPDAEHEKEGPAAPAESSPAEEEPQTPEPEQAGSAPEEPEDTAPSPPGPEAPPEAPRRRELDPAIAQVLREEAEREAKARAAARTSLESQPDLGLEQAESTHKADDARSHVQPARPHGDDVAEPAPATAATAGAARRDLLPDIDEINSTLRSSHDRAPDEYDADDIDEEYPTDGQRRGGFTSGFVLVIVVVALLWALYVFAPRLSALAPPLKPALDSYVTAIDNGRVWLDKRIHSGLKWLDAKASDTGGDGTADGS